MKIGKRAIEMNTTLTQKGDSVSNVIGTDHVVGHDDRGYLELQLESPDKLVDRIGDNGVESGRWLIICLLYTSPSPRD